MPVVRIAWDDFPLLLVHAARTRLACHPSLAETYEAAKHGDLAQARALADALSLFRRNPSALQA